VTGLLFPQLARPALYAVFAGNIEQLAVHRLFHITTTAAQNGMDVHLLMQSTGGNVQDGVCIYNFLKTFPTEVTVYNVGTVASAAVIAFLGARKRKASAHASFMIHRTYASPQFLTSDRMQSQLASIVIDDERTEAILRENTQFPEDRWQTHKAADVWLTAQEAVQFGFAHEIGDFAPPLGSLVTNVLPG
jgi:ATP-dependent Clp protease, protease subunit